jgi:hypothetical protein
MGEKQPHPQLTSDNQGSRRASPASWVGQAFPREHISRGVAGGAGRLAVRRERKAGASIGAFGFMGFLSHI